ncbi:MAG: hypothetical protein ACI7YS_09475 [Flavobacterium sp.]
MGFSSQLIIADYSNDRKNSSFTLGVSTLIVFTCIFGIFGFYGSNSTFGVIFNLGSGISLITVSLLNGKLRFKEAFWFWLVLFFIQLLGLSLMYFLNSDDISVINSFAILYLVTAVLFLIAYEGKSIILKYSKFINTKQIISDALKLGLFGSLFMIGYNLLFKVMAGTDAEKAIFSLGYQLFSLVIFLPSILGSYIVPLMSSGNGLNKFGKMKKAVILQLCYGLVAVIIIAFILIFFKQILELYKISYEEHLFAILFFILLAGFICSCSTGIVHLNNSLKRFKVLTYGSFTWIGAMCLCLILKYFLTGYFQLTVQESAIVFAFSYMFYFLFFIIDFYKYCKNEFHR